MRCAVRRRAIPRRVMRGAGRPPGDCPVEPGSGGDDQAETLGRKADRHPLAAHGGEAVGLAAVGEDDERVGSDGELQPLLAVEPARTAAWSAVRACATSESSRSSTGTSEITAVRA